MRCCVEHIGKKAPNEIHSNMCVFVFLSTFSDSPELIFVSPFVPLHPHVYSNGHICLSILYDHWSPALGVKACCISLLSMLSSNHDKQPPPDDKLYCQARGAKGPKGVRWIFHDDRV